MTIQRNNYRPATSFESIQLGKGLITKGQADAGDNKAVTELQTKLNSWLKAQGKSEISVDGKFGKQTDKALRAWQSAQGLKADGKFGKDSFGAMAGSGRAPAEQQPPAQPPKQPVAPPKQPAAPPKQVEAGPAPTPVDPQVTQQEQGGRLTPAQIRKGPPAGATEAEKFAFYKRVVEQSGGQMNPGGRPTVLGVRMNEPSYSKGYNDKMIVLTKDGKVHEFKGSTVPSSARGPSDPSRADGQRHMGYLPPGNYVVAGADKGNYKGRGGAGYLIGDGGEAPAWRDYNNDGRVSDAEKQRSRQHGERFTGLRWHPGFSGPSSIGCQTLNQADSKRFDALMRKGSFSYTLVHAF